MKQQKFKGKAFETEIEFGGSLLKGNARKKRPLNTKLPLHTVVRTAKASLRRPAIYRDVNLIITRAAKKHGLTIKDFANVGNHIHMCLKVPHRLLWRRFIREITGRIAQLVQGLKGPQKGEKFWLDKPYTKVVASWGKPYQALKNYIFLNQMEGEGNIRRSETPTYKSYLAIFAEDW